MAYKTEVIEKLSAFLTAAFGLVAALAWNSSIQIIFQRIFGQQSSVTAMIIYALVVTIVAVAITIWIGRLASKYKERDEQRQKARNRR